MTETARHRHDESELDRIIGARELLAQARRRYWRRLLSRFAVSAAACVAVGLIALTELHRSQPLPKVATKAPGASSTSLSTTGTTAPPTTTPVAHLRAAPKVTVGLNPIEVTSDASGVWVGNLNSKSLTRIDPSTRDVTATIPLPCEPRDVAAAAGSIWVTCQDTKTIAQVAEATGRVVTQLAGGDIPGEIVAAGDSVWATDRGDPSAVRRIDANTGTVTAAIAIGQHLLPISATTDAVWVADEGGNAVYRIDPTTNTVTATIAETGEISNLLATADRVYVSKNDGTIDAIDPTTNRIVVRSGVLASGGFIQTLDGMTLFDGSLYVTAPGVGVLAVDPATLTSQYRIAEHENWHYLTAAGSLLFVPDEGGNTVTVLTGP